MHSVRHFRSGGRANARKVQKRTMDKKGKQQFLLVAFGVALYAALMNLNEVAAFLTRLATLFTPVIIGLLMAFVLSVPMQGIAGRLTRLMPKAKEKHIDLLSLLLTLLCVVIVVVLLCVLALPQLAASLKSIGTLVRENWPDWARLLSDHGVDTSELTDRIAALDWKTVLEKALTGAGALIDSVVDLAGTTVSAVANVTFAIVIMFYVLLDRRSLAKQSRRLLYANLSERKADQVCRIARLTHTTYARFLSGQCVEAVILGTLFVITMSILGMPYAMLTGIVIAITALIPIFGAFIGCVIGMLLIVMVDPVQAVWFLVLFLVLQQIEGNLIYPHVVGSSVGLPSIWVLVAVTVGGNMFGILGILVFIPLCSVLYALFAMFVKKRLREREIPESRWNAPSGGAAATEPAEEQSCG